MSSFVHVRVFNLTHSSRNCTICSFLEHATVSGAGRVTLSSTFDFFDFVHEFPLLISGKSASSVEGFRKTLPQNQDRTRRLDFYF